MSGEKRTVVTHDGVFHADEVFAVALLHFILKPDTWEVVRTRDIVTIMQAWTVLDVGRVYSPKDLRYDHHHPEFNEVRPNGVPYATFGLLLREPSVREALAHNLQMNPDVADEIIGRLDRELAQGIDAHDTGHGAYVNTKTASNMISDFNPTWTDDSDWDAAFKEAVKWAVDVLGRTLKNISSAVNGSRLVRKQADMVPPGVRILVMEDYIPWQSIVSIEYPEILFVVFPGPGEGWRVQGVPQSPTTREVRKKLPAQWAGKEADDLKQLGWRNAVFCHRGRFIAGSTTKQEAIEMAFAAVQGEHVNVYRGLLDDIGRLL